MVVISRGLNREQVDENGIITANSSDEVSTRAIYKEWKRLNGGVKHSGSVQKIG